MIDYLTEIFWVLSRKIESDHKHYICSSHNIKRTEAYPLNIFMRWKHWFMSSEKWRWSRSFDRWSNHPV